MFLTESYSGTSLGIYFNLLWRSKTLNVTDKKIFYGGHKEGFTQLIHFYLREVTGKKHICIGIKSLKNLFLLWLLN